jgi:light-regulated signal transduction histidine kinase (bacteriophytochrome)
MRQESNDVPRDEREHLARALKECSNQLEAVTREFEQFTETLSHDLRAPLRATEGFSRILLEDYGDKFDGDAKQCLETVASSARKASALIEALNGFARLSRKPLRPALLNMRELAGQKAAEFKAGGAAASFKIEALPEAWGDPDLVDSILNNLIDNAVKFSRRQPQPSIKITGRAEDGTTVYCVRDNGIGFNPQYASRLFGVFQRLHEDGQFEGRGMGLATVQRLVHRHGGKVWAESKPGAGAAFFFSLPARSL